MLQRLGEWNEKRIHSNPVVDVNVGQGVSGHVVKERQVEEAALLPVDLGVGEDEVKDRHEEDVSAKEYQEWVVHTRSKGVGKEYQDEETTQNLKNKKADYDQKWPQ